MHCLIRRLAPAIVAAGLAVAADAARAETHTIVIQFFQFKPQAVEVKAGDEVQWVNRDLLEHTATASNNAFDSKGIRAGQTWKWTAKAPGEYAYVCSFHPNMKGVVKVVP
ncbi:MAG TPA: cupredoxin family copper-binding protein [Casimicrobiaceae bacterium]